MTDDPLRDKAAELAELAVQLGRVQTVETFVFLDVDSVPVKIGVYRLSHYEAQEYIAKEVRKKIETVAGMSLYE